MILKATWLITSGDDRVYLAGHDGRTVLFGRQVDLAKAGAGAGGHQAQVIGHFGKAQGAGAQHPETWANTSTCWVASTKSSALTKGQASDLPKGDSNVPHNPGWR